MKAKFIKTTLSNVIQIHKIVTIHDFDFDDTFSFEGESHDFWELAYITKGTIIYAHEQGETVVSEGEIFFTAPNKFHASRALNSAPGCVNITFECNSAAMKSFENYHAKLDKKLLPFLNNIVAESKVSYDIPKNAVSLNKLTKKESQRLGSEQLIRTYLEQFLIMLLRSLTESEELFVFPSKESMQHHLAEDVKAYVEKNITAVIRTEDVCAHLGYSKTYVSKIFHTFCGDTIAHYVTERKIEKAKTLFAEKKMNVTEVSDYLGFDNPQYFSRVFKRVTGLSPTEYKNAV